jgi:hypothetical protein
MSFTDQVDSICFRARLDVGPIGEVCRLIKYRHVERRRVINWVKLCTLT